LERLLKQKLLRLTLLLETPKEEVLEVLPFAIAKAILLIVEAKVTESLANIHGDKEDDQGWHHYETQVSIFVFGRLNSGTALSASAVSHLLAKFTDRLPVEKNA